MRATLDLRPESLTGFTNTCNVMISKVGNGSRKAAVRACEEILERSLEQVPVDTATLAQSASYSVTGDYKTGWQGRVGYAVDIDPVNPKTGKAASQYALTVHEDLETVHVIGKAKFLEDPARDYARENFPRTVFKHMQESLAGYGGK